MGTLDYKRSHGPTAAQQNAIDLLIAGLNDSEVAESIGVCRTTVTKWRLYDPTFQVTLSQRRAELLSAASDTLRAVVPLAIDTVKEQLRVGLRRDRLALDFLTRTGLIGTRGPGAQSAPAVADPAAVGPTRLEDLLDAEVRRARAHAAATLGAQDADSDLLTPVDAPVTPEERDAAYQHLMSLAAAPDTPAAAAPGPEPGA